MDRLRQGVFSSIGAAIENARVADLFAGTGSYGLEALSRGAQSAHFVELNRNACAMIKENIRIVAKSMARERLDATVVPGDALKSNGLSDGEFDLIFVDPPYEIIEASAPRIFSTLSRILAKNGRVVFEMPGRLEFSPDGWTLIKRIGKGKGQPTACVFQQTPADA